MIALLVVALLIEAGLPLLYARWRSVIRALDLFRFGLIHVLALLVLIVIAARASILDFGPNLLPFAPASIIVSVILGFTAGIASYLGEVLWKAQWPSRPPPGKIAPFVGSIDLQRLRRYGILLLMSAVLEEIVWRGIALHELRHDAPYVALAVTVCFGLTHARSGLSDVIYKPGSTVDLGPSSQMIMMLGLVVLGGLWACGSCRSAGFSEVLVVGAGVVFSSASGSRECGPGRC